MSTDATQSADYDVAIAGAGVAGLSAAWFLANAGARVVVLERESQPAYHASGRSAALYIESYEGAVVSELTQASKDFFFTPPAGFSETPLVHPRGGLTIAGPGEEAALKAYLTTWQTRCPELVPASVDDALRLCPILNPDWLRDAAYDPSWQSIDTHALMQGFQRGLRQQGGTLLTNAAITGLKRAHDHWVIEHSGDEHSGDEHSDGGAQVRARVIANASGAWANELAAMAGLSALSLTPMRRTAALIEAPDGASDWPVVRNVGDNFYFKPESPGLMVSPQDEVPSEPMDAFPEELDVAIALDRFSQATRHPVSRVLHQWAGLRTFAPDRQPVLGFDPRVSGFFWLAGQGGFGVQTSPRLGELAAQAILNNAPVAPAIHAQRLL